MSSVTSFQIGAVCSVDYVNRYGDLVFTSKAMNKLQNDSMKTKQKAQLPQRQRAMRMMLILNIQGHSRPSVVVPIDAAHMTSY